MAVHIFFSRQVCILSEKVLLEAVVMSHERAKQSKDNPGTFTTTYTPVIPVVTPNIGISQINTYRSILPVLWIHNVLYFRILFKLINRLIYSEYSSAHSSTPSRSPSPATPPRKKKNKKASSPIQRSPHISSRQVKFRFIFQNGTHRK